ncbi:MAG TPA: hypothetical protein VLQ91_12205 [Draconibacterium sp.]|nr:hypothetical protein [Draconibacterium sp.]
MPFEDNYSKTSDNSKLKFLNGIIGKNISLQNEFVNFIESEQNVAEVFPFKSFLELISSIKKKYLERLENVDIENPDWESYHAPHSGYIEEWEAYQQASEQEFETIFGEFLTDAINKIIGQKPVEIMAMLIGFYEATQDAEIEDDIGSFEDVNEYLLEEFTSTVETITEKLKMAAISEKLILSAIEKFAEYCDAEYPGNAHFVGYFEHLLIALAEKSSMPNQILSIIDQSTIERAAVPELVLLLNKLAGNTTEWLFSAKQFYLINTEVAKQLLQYYFETDKGSFVITANELFNKDKHVWAKFLKDFVSIELNKSLYVNIFRHLAVNEKQIKYYLKIREYLSDSEINRLLKEVDWDKLFVVEILEVEKRYESIREIVEKNSNDWQYEKLIRPIISVYPEFCFQHIKNKTIITIENQRGRDVYERIASWLKLTWKIPGFEIEKRDLILQLYNHKPNLPALKDEMKKAGLIK